MEAFAWAIYAVTAGLLTGVAAKMLSKLGWSWWSVGLSVGWATVLLVSGLCVQGAVA